MKVWLVLNLLVYIGAAWWDGWHGVGALLLLQVIGSVILGAVFVYGIAGRENPSQRRIRGRVNDLLARSAIAHHALFDGCDGNLNHGTVLQPDGTIRVYCPNELGEPW